MSAGRSAEWKQTIVFTNFSHLRSIIVLSSLYSLLPLLLIHLPLFSPFSVPPLLPFLSSSLSSLPPSPPSLPPSLSSSLSSLSSLPLSLPCHHQVFMEDSGKDPGIIHPFGYLKASSSLAHVTLFVMPFNYSALLPLISKILVPMCGKMFKLKGLPTLNQFASIIDQNNLPGPPGLHTKCFSKVQMWSIQLLALARQQLRVLKHTCTCATNTMY